MPFPDTLAKGTLILGAIGLVVGYWNYAKPTLHGIKFEAGMCNYTNLTVERDEVSCSCGKSCTGYYPCLVLQGHFMVNETENSTQSDFNGTFYKDYPALKKECLLVPSCSRRFNDNSEKVYEYLQEVLFPYVNSTLYPGPYNLSTVVYNHSELIPCYGKDHLMYFDMKYALWKAIVSLAVPGGVFLIGILITLTCSSSDHKETVLSIIGLPFFIIAAVLVGIAEILNIDGACRGCFHKLRACFRSCRSPAPSTRSTQREVSIETLDREERRTRTRRRSTDIAIGTMDMEMSTDRPRRNSLILSSSPRARIDTEPSRRWSASSADSVSMPSFYGGATAPSYEPQGFRLSANPAPRFDPPPNYDAGGADSAPAPPPSYNDVMSGSGPGGFNTAPSYNYSSS